MPDPLLSRDGVRLRPLSHSLARFVCQYSTDALKIQTNSRDGGKGSFFRIFLTSTSEGPQEKGPSEPKVGPWPNLDPGPSETTSRCPRIHPCKREVSTQASQQACNQVALVSRRVLNEGEEKEKKSDDNGVLRRCTPTPKRCGGLHPQEVSASRRRGGVHFLLQHGRQGMYSGAGKQGLPGSPGSAECASNQHGVRVTCTRNAATRNLSGTVARSCVGTTVTELHIPVSQADDR